MPYTVSIFLDINSLLNKSASDGRKYAAKNVKIKICHLHNCTQHVPVQPLSPRDSPVLERSTCLKMAHCIKKSCISVQKCTFKSILAIY